MLVSCFKAVASTEPPQLKEVSWTDFVQKLSTHLELADKTKAPAISPAEWPKGISRNGKKVLRVHFAALDLDKITDDVLTAVLKILAPYQYFLHTTHSHAVSDLNCLRVYLPLSKPVEALQWPTFWNNLNAFVGGVLDKACKDAGRVYFVPSAPPGMSDKNYCQSHDGQVLDVEPLLVKRAFPKTKGQFVSQTALMSLAYGLMARHDANRKALGAQILKVAQGEVFAENGERDTTLFKICAQLADKWPKADPKQIATLFEPSLSKMRAESDDAPTLQDVVDKFSRKQTKAPQLDLGGLEGKILDAFRGKRSTPYTEEELDGFAAEAGIPRSRLNQRWIVRKADTCYLFLGGQYKKPVSLRELVQAAQVYLAPACTADVDCYRYTEKGNRIPKKEQELIHDYSTFASEVIVDLSAQKSTYDWNTETLTEAPCPLRDLKPEFSGLVDTYLRLLGGKSQEALLDWVALVTKLEKPCAALFLYGASGAGKSLLSLGLTRLWTVNTPTLLKNVLADFNDSLPHSPLVVADEGVSGSTKKQGGSAEIRSLIQEYTRPLKRKFKDMSTLHGSLRLIVTANNKKAFSWKESLNSDDVKALQDRILSIKVGEDSAAYLRSLGNTREELFVRGDAIAKHALWLRDNRKVDNDLRFLVAGDDSSQADEIISNTKMGPHVSDWLVCYLLNPQRIDALGTLQIRIYQGQLLVRARCLVENWESYVTNKDKRFATLNNISEALASMSGPKRKQLYDNNKVKTNYQQIETRYLLSWAESKDYNPDQILAALSKDTSSVYTGDVE